MSEEDSSMNPDVIDEENYSNPYARWPTEWEQKWAIWAMIDKERVDY